MAPINQHKYHLGSLLEMLIHRTHPRPTEYETLGCLIFLIFSTTNILASCLGDSEAQGLRTSDHSQSFHHYEIETGTHWALLFHALSYISYHTWLQVLSICCYLLSWYVWTFPWDPIKCLPGCFTRTSYLKVQNPSLLLQGHTSQQMCMLLPSCSNQQPGNVLSHSFLPHPPLCNSSKCQFCFWNSSKQFSLYLHCYRHNANHHCFPLPSSSPVPLLAFPVLSIGGTHSNP